MKHQDCLLLIMQQKGHFVNGLFNECRCKNVHFWGGDGDEA